MKAIPTLLALCLLTSACAGRTQTAGDIQSIDDPEFTAWYKTATPYMRAALFVTLCATQGLRNGSIEINFCVSNMKRDARIRIEGAL